MQHKVTDVVYRRFNEQCKSKQNLWNANPPNSAKWWNFDKKTSSPDTQSHRVQMPECVNYSRKWLCLGNKYFLTRTSISTSGSSTSTSTSAWHASTSTSTRKLYFTTDQVPVPVPSTRLWHTLTLQIVVRPFQQSARICSWRCWSWACIEQLSTFKGHSACPHSTEQISIRLQGILQPKCHPFFPQKGQTSWKILPKMWKSPILAILK